MKKNINWDLILMYFEGTCPEDCEKKVMEWKNRSEENRNQFELIKNIWNTRDLSLPKVDVEKSLKLVKQRIRNFADYSENQKSEIFKVKYKNKYNQYINSITLTGYLRLAAVVLILFSGVYFFSNLFRNNLMKEIDVKNKDLKEITLSDGSVIELDAGSSLKYPEEFGDDKREVYLIGEAYFNVTSNQKTPFIVHTGKAEITVLGTKFNVRAWEETRKVAVVVVDGTVSLSSQNADNNKSEVTISAGKMSVLDKNGFLSDAVEIDTEQYLAWMNREYYFQSAPLSEVLNQLNRWYDIDFSLPADSYASNRITVYLRNQPIEDNLELISMIMNFHYLINGNRVTFKLNE